MFTGLVESCGRVQTLTRTATEARLTVATSIPTDELQLGDSVSVNGACLTVVAKDSTTFTVDMSPETFERTTFKSMPKEGRVNLERALRVGDRLGGHIVTGHIDVVGTVLGVKKSQNAVVVEIEVPTEYSRYIIAKGSVAIDGISLTINDVKSNQFSVSIIPHTLKETTLTECKSGVQVNIETDILGKYVERLLGVEKGSGQSSKLTSDFLAKHGFM
jgi:riboflavin synthase